MTLASQDDRKDREPINMQKAIARERLRHDQSNTSIATRHQSCLHAFRFRDSDPQSAIGRAAEWLVSYLSTRDYYVKTVSAAFAERYVSIAVIANILPSRKDSSQQRPDWSKFLIGH